jgi:acyl-CoA-binding protein
LYALYKQATAGTAPALCLVSSASSTGSWNVVAAQAKHAAWRKLAGMPRGAAIFQYIATAEIHLDEAAAGRAEYDDDDEDDSTEPVQNTTSGGTPALAAGLGVSVSRPVEGSLATTTSPLINGDDTDDDGSRPGNNDAAAQFLQAAAADNLAQVTYFVEDRRPQTLDINHKDDVGQTALHLAADHGAVRVLEYLLQKEHIKVNAADEQGISVLQAAVIAGQVTACRLLLAAGADPDQADEDGDTPRHCAADDGAEELRRLFAPTQEDAA